MSDISPVACHAPQPASACSSSLESEVAPQRSGRMFARSRRQHGTRRPLERLIFGERDELLNCIYVVRPPPHC
jgi:hypothetical protein